MEAHMSAYTTVYITRSTAIAKITNQMSSATNDELATILDVALENKLMNCVIVSDGADNDDELIDW